MSGAEMEPNPPRIDELDRLRLQNVVLQLQLGREQMNVLVAQFLQTPQPRALQERIDGLGTQMNDLVRQIYVTAAVDPERYQVNVVDGTFVPRKDKQ